MEGRAGGGGGQVVRLEPGWRTPSCGVGMEGSCGARVARLLSVDRPPRRHPGGEQEGRDEGRGDGGGADPGHQEAEGEDTNAGAAGDPAYDHGGLQHARHEPDAVGQSVANQAVQSREHLRPGWSTLIGRGPSRLCSHWLRSWCCYASSLMP